MVGTIGPIGDRGRIKRITSWPALAFLVGAALGGLSLGSILAASHIIMPNVVSAIADIRLMALLAVLAVLIEVRGIQLRLSLLPRQVPPWWWIRYRPSTAALLSGWQIGFGLLTHIPWIGFYVVLLVSMESGVTFSLVSLSTFGIIRGAQPLIARWLTGWRRMAIEEVLAVHSATISPRFITSMRWIGIACTSVMIAMVGT